MLIDAKEKAERAASDILLHQGKWSIFTPENRESVK